MAYEVVIDPAAEKDLRSLGNDKKLLGRLAEKIRSLATEPRPRGVENLSGRTHRVRIGDYRILYDIEDRRVLVVVLRVRHRRDV